MMPVLLMATPEASSHDLMALILRSNVLNVLLVAAFLGFLVKKFNLFNGIDQQRQKITSEVEACEKQKQEALAQLDEIKKRTANLKKEVEGILNNAKESADAMAAQIIADAQDESTKMIENLKKRMILEQRAAVKTLEDRLLGEALAAAHTELVQSLSEQDRHLSIEAFIDTLGNWQPPSVKMTGGVSHE